MHIMQRNVRYVGKSVNAILLILLNFYSTSVGDPSHFIEGLRVGQMLYRSLWVVCVALEGKTYASCESIV